MKIFLYQCQLAWQSICRNPILSALMVLCLASGITAMMVFYTFQYATVRNPLAHKDNTLFMLQTDSWHLKEAYEGRPSNQMPDYLSYRDVFGLMRSDIPLRKTAIVHWGGVASLPENEVKPSRNNARINTRDYFDMFEESFEYGGVWSKEADEHLQNVVVLGAQANQKLFHGKDSVGKTILFEKVLYQVVGVLKQKDGPNNKMQDIDRETLGADTDLFFSFGILSEREVSPWGLKSCPIDLHDYGTGYQALLKGSCVWLTYWVEFSEPKQKQDYEQFITQYIQDQKTQGFYPRPLLFALSNATQKLEINGYTRSDLIVLVYIGEGFLIICAINSMAILLAKFLRNSSKSVVRRALGASRLVIFCQHLIESAFIGVLGGILGILFTYSGLNLIRYGFRTKPMPSGFSESSFEPFFTLDTHLLLLTVAIAVVASLCAGIYPAWRICRIPVAQCLKMQ